ncbi:MAG: YfhO family protein, partial [Bulleidia sp.]
VYFISDSDLQSVYEELKEKDHFTNVSQEHGNLSADITITGTADKMAMVSIPYNEGWTVLVDGKKTDTEYADLCMTGFWLTPGEHHVEFLFTPQGLHQGIMISAAAFASFLFLISADKKKRKISN